MVDKKALRFNTGKLRYDLLPVEWEEELVKVFTKGSFKYAANNWKNSVGTEKSKEFKEGCLASARRHIAKYQKGKRFDNERVLGAEHIKTYHLAHAAWNLLAILFYDIMEQRIRRRSS